MQRYDAVSASQGMSRRAAVAGDLIGFFFSFSHSSGAIRHVLRNRVRRVRAAT